MKFRTLIAAAIVALLPLAATAATIVVPAAGTGAGASGSHWQSELTLHNAAPRAATVTLTYHQGSEVFGPVSVSLAARQTLSIPDVARTQFNVASGSGALVLQMEDRSARSIAVTSRTFNSSPESEFGQNVPAIDVSSAVAAGELAAIAGPSTALEHRFNFGLFTLEPTTVTWEVLRADGTVAASKSESYAAGQHAQYGSGVENFLASTPEDNDMVHARVITGRAIFYGSVINATGDPSFVAGTRTRDDVIIRFAGVDLDENGTVDVFDANDDGILDQPLTIYTSLFPAYFRLVSSGEFGETLEYEILSSSASRSHLLDGNGTMRLIASGDLKNKSGEVKLKVKTGSSSTIITLPVLFR